MTPEVEALIDAILELGLYCEEQKIELKEGKVNHLETVMAAINSVVLIEHRQMMAREEHTLH